MDFSRILGAVLQGAVQPPRRTTRGSRARSIPGFGTSRSSNAQLARALTGLATVAMEALSNRQSPPPPDPAPRRPVPDLRAPAPSAPPPAAQHGSVPNTGPAASPWTPRPAPPSPAPEAETAEALLMIRAMIAAARADGSIDAAERAAIARQLDAAGLTSGERDFVLADFDAPLTPAALAKEVRDPMQAAQLYAGAYAAMGTISEAERSWLDTLARALKLDRAAAGAIEARLGG
ncbi:DUF533 domain-containing protein [Plastoroseomonas arctica]|uniref:Tellurite resistance TerB family protein n=1 Tax=Plastoroseomonas arctica TaxID=1509237 RepID=A0AAF1K5Z6_9PROT|nr:DUF533 domain-containing protein [Plastoroseomonas arctica]MBR0656619.1 tellurite resistance TerB family protein [Plastoroseomonas arctica]